MPSLGGQSQALPSTPTGNASTPLPRAPAARDSSGGPLSGLASCCELPLIIENSGGADRQLPRAQLRLRTRNNEVECHCREIHLRACYLERRRERDHILVVAADIQNQAHRRATDLQVARKSDLKHSIGQLAPWCNTVGMAHFHPQRQTQSIDITNFRMLFAQLP